MLPEKNCCFGADKRVQMQDAETVAGRKDRRTGYELGKDPDPVERPGPSCSLSSSGCVPP